MMYRIKHIFNLSCLLLSISLAQISLAQGARQGADLVIVHANVYTLDKQAPKARALAVKDGHIVFVGTALQSKAWLGNNSVLLDLKGYTLLPGLTDAHYHLSGVGFRELRLNLESVSSLDELKKVLVKRSKTLKAGQWLTGRGWIETFWPNKTFPTRWDLDQVVSQHPVFLTRADGHGAVANSAALKIAGITASTQAPVGGEIMHNEQGLPNGMLLDHALQLITRHIPQPSEAEQEQALVVGAERSTKMGWTQIQNAGNGFAMVERLTKLYQQKRVKLKVYSAINGPGPDAQQLLQQGARLKHDRLQVRSIKIHFDGALGSKGAALLQPYQDHPGNGFLTESKDTVMPMLKQALRRGIQVQTHAIGDRANRTILDWYQEAFNAVPKSQRLIAQPRWRIEHAQLIHADDLPRFKSMQVIPSMQPSHAISDLHFAANRVGLDRLKGAYAWRSLLASGVIVAGGSDAPVEQGDPLIEFYAAIARKDLKGFSGPGWHPEQAVSREQALKMLTLWPAYAAFQEAERGSIEVGKAADFSVFSGDIMQIAPPEILLQRNLMTLIDGEVVYRSGLF